MVLRYAAIWMLASGALSAACAACAACHGSATPTAKPPALGRDVDAGRLTDRRQSDADLDAGRGQSSNAPPVGRGSLDAPVLVKGNFDVKTALPELPHLENVVGAVGPDSVAITFLPFDDARDYRVYVLPDDKDVVTEADGVHVSSAIYRCAGMREVPDVDVDDRPKGYNLGVRTLVDNQDVGGYRRTLAEAVLGHVHYLPGAGRVPVFALGDPDARADNIFYLARVSASRSKRYTTSTAERDMLLGAGWRDDGVAFYVPAASGSNTNPVYTSLDTSELKARYYFSADAERQVRTGSSEAFPVLKAAASETQPLYRVHYTKAGGYPHDELAVGKTMFERVRFQGSDKPVTELLWSGITKPTTLVVEALDSVCPYAGRLAAASIPAATADTVAYPEAITPQQAQDAAPHHELFINGQSETQTPPRAVARAFLQVAPTEPLKFDWFAGFESDNSLGQLTEVSCNPPPNQTCFQSWRETSSAFDVHWHTVVTGQRAIGAFMGELWVRYADWAADTNGKFRITPTRKARVEDNSFLHVTMEVTSISTSRRYPQILISDRDAPIQDYLDQGNTLLFEIFRDFPNYLEVQICDHRTWEVNLQCPFFQFYERKDAQGELASLAPVDEVGELTAPDKRTRFDVFVSSKRAFVMMERKPFGCVELPESGVPRGDVTVTFGDVLYHSGIDSPRGYHKKYLQFDTERRFDNLGFSSRVPEPVWDFKRLPCAPASSIDEHR